MPNLSSLKSAFQNSATPINWYSCIDSGFYKTWLTEQSSQLDQEVQSSQLDQEVQCFQESSFSKAPFFSIVVPLFNTPTDFLKAMIDSVIAQSFHSWELLLINASAQNHDMLTVINAYSDKRIKHILLEENRGIAGNTNAGIDAATGQFIGFFDHDDALNPQALATYYRYISSNPMADALYCDEAIVNENGDYVVAHFKGSFNLDLLRCHNYITHFLVVRNSLAKELRLDSAFDGAQDYDFVLRLAERTSNFVHIPHVLYDWRAHDGSTAGNTDSKDYAEEAGRKALQAHADRLCLNATARTTSSRCVYNLDYELQEHPKVAIIIFGNNLRQQQRCAKSITATTDYPAELFTIFRTSEGGSSEAISKELRCGSYEYCVFLSEDSQIATAGWIQNMLSVCQRADVGVVGARINHPDGRLYHAGLALVPNAAHDAVHDGKVKAAPNAAPNGKIFARVFENSAPNDGGYFERAIVRQRVTGVDTCIMTSTSLLERTVGAENILGQLRSANSDEAALVALDFCLQVQAEGLSVIYEPRAEFIIQRPMLGAMKCSLFGNSPHANLSESSFREKWKNELHQGDLFFGEAFLKAALT